MKLSIGEIAKACGGRLVPGTDTDEKMQITSLEIDSRKIMEGSAFLATVGERVDGHRFISQVFEKGALVAITQKTPEQVEAQTGISCAAWGSYILVEDTLQALRDIGEYYRMKLGIPVVGIAGSVGKTSTKEFVATVLEEQFRVLKTQGNYNNEIGVPLTLLQIREEHQVAVIEMGISDFGEMHRLSKMARPNVCVMTNIGQCHLENLKDRDGILRAKSEIFDFMAEDGNVVINGDDDKLITLDRVKGRKPLCYALEQTDTADYAVTELTEKGLWGTDATLIRRADGEMKRLHVPLPGRHMVLNAAAAACVGGIFGLSMDQIAAGIEKVQPISGRNHLIRLGSITLVDDCYNANPGSMKAALSLLALADNTRVAILGDMFELGEESDQLHGQVGDYAVHSGVNRLICVGENSVHMYESALAACRELSSETGCEIFYFASREELLRALWDDAKKYIPQECTVLLKASHGMQFTLLLDFFREHYGA